MLKAEKNIKYSGQCYKKGEIIDHIDKKEEKRLVKIGAASFYDPIGEEKIFRNAEIDPECVIDESSKAYELLNEDDLLKLTQERELIPKSHKKDDLIACLEEDEEEFDALIEQLENQGVIMPEEATKAELLELLTAPKKA